MHATSFPEENQILDKPPEMSVEECAPLPVWRGLVGPGRPCIISCWKPTKAELEEIERTGRIWVMVAGSAMPPIIPLGFSPFREGLEAPDG